MPVRYPRGQAAWATGEVPVGTGLYRNRAHPPPAPLGSDLPADRCPGRSEDKAPNCQHWGLLGNGTPANSKKWILFFMSLVF